MIIKDKAEFDKLINENDYVVADFYADWCGPCKMLGPIFEEVSKEMNDVVMCKINVDDCSELATQYSIESIPTILFFKNKEAIGKAMGFMSKEVLIEKIKSYK